MTVRGSAEPVYTVHVTRPGEVGAIEIIFRSERDARSYARDRSRDFRITSVSVTRFVLTELGNRHPVAWYGDGEEQPLGLHRPDRQYYPTDGSPAPPSPVHSEGDCTRQSTSG